MALEDDISGILAGTPQVQLGILFGSVASGEPRWDSDLDLGVMGEQPLSADQKMELVERLAQVAGRAVDLVDLQRARGAIVGQILQTGKRIYDVDNELYARLIKRHLFDQEDMAPYRRRILAERRRAWIGS